MSDSIPDRDHRIVLHTFKTSDEMKAILTSWDEVGHLSEDGRPGIVAYTVIIKDEKR